MAGDAKQANALNMSGFGDKLREAREKKSLTIGQVQKQTHIHSAILKALEEGNCDNFLNHTYVRSFLKKYSDHLGLDSGQILKDYDKLHPKIESGKIKKPPEPEAPSRWASNIIPFIKVLIVGAVAIALAAFVGGKVISHFKKPHAVKRASVSKVKQPSARLKSLKKVSGERAPLKKDVAPKKEKDVDAAIPKNVQLKLLLKVNQTVRIKIRTDGNLLFDHVLQKGTGEIFTADKSINIYTADGAVTELVLNGKPIGPLKKGVLEDIEITRTGVRFK